MATRRVQRTLSVFQPSTRVWAPVPSACVPTHRHAAKPFSRTSRLSLVSQNLDAFSPRSVSRAKLLLSDILKESRRPDILFLQEVTSDARASILANPDVREAFLVSDAEDETSFVGVPFANMTLLSSRRFSFEAELQSEEKLELGEVSRVMLPSKYGRCALSVDVTLSVPPSTCRLINVHLDSLGDTFLYRAAQLEILAGLLREPECDGGLIAGDFNAISARDHALIHENGLVDAWSALRGDGDPNGATWGVGGRRRDGLGPGRLDKIAVLGVGVEDVEILPPGQVEVPKPSGVSNYIPYSDHCALRLIFAV